MLDKSQGQERDNFVQAQAYTECNGTMFEGFPKAFGNSPIKGSIEVQKT